MSKSNKIIAVVIDDVLALSVEQVIEYSNRNWKTSLTIAEFHENLTEMWGLSMADAEARWQQYLASGAMSRIKPHPGALGVLQKLKERFILVPLTSRRDHLKAMTQDWVTQYMQDVLEPVRTVGIAWGIDPHAWKVTKASAVVEIGADYLIDDQTKHCLAVAETGKTAILFGDYPWNRMDNLPMGVVRCADWPAVEEYFARVV